MTKILIGDRTLREDITYIALSLTQKLSKIQLAEDLGITRPTLDRRLESHLWRKLEITAILRLNERNT